jgi:hypothetical protein
MHRFMGLFVAFAVGVAHASAATMPMPTPVATSAPLTDAEKAFVQTTSTQLGQLYPDTAAAKTAGYALLEGAIDSDNTYNWTNFAFKGVDPGHPNFLWFDRNGHLAGVDWELPKSAYASAPSGDAYPVQVSRWTSIPEHVHFAYTVNGTTHYGAAKATAALRQGTITAQQLRASGAKLPANATLVWAMYHPAVWDLAMWVVPNPNGAFAELNPNVK